MREATTAKTTTVPDLKTTTRRRGLGSYGRSMLLLAMAATVGLVIPNLLDYPGAVVVVDVKPENAAVTGVGLSRRVITNRGTLFGVRAVPT